MPIGNLLVFINNPICNVRNCLNFISKLLEVLKTDFKETEYINKSR